MGYEFAYSLSTRNYPNTNIYVRYKTILTINCYDKVYDNINSCSKSYFYDRDYQSEVVYIKCISPLDTKWKTGDVRLNEGDSNKYYIWGKL